MIESRQKNITLFRENAVLHLNTIQEPDTLFANSGPGYYVWLLLGIICIVAFSLWLFLGNIAQTILASGMVMPVDSKAVPMVALQSGFVTEVNAKSGDAVKTGEILVKINNPVFNEELFHAEQDKIYHEKRLQNAFKDYASAKTVLDEKFKNKKAALAQRILDHKDQYTTLRSVYLKKKLLLQKQYITITEVTKSKSEFLAEKEAFQNTKMEFQLLEQNYKEALEPYFEKIKQYDVDYRQSKHSYEQQLLAQQTALLRAAASSVVLESYANVGQYVTVGSTLFTLLENANNQLEVLAFVHPLAQKNIQSDGDVLVYVDPQSNCEAIRAKIKSISPYPVSKETVYVHIGNREWVNQVFSNGAPYLVTVAFSTINHKNLLKIVPGMTVLVKILTRTCSPLKHMMRRCG